MGREHDGGETRPSPPAFGSDVRAAYRASLRGGITDRRAVGADGGELTVSQLIEDLKSFNRKERFILLERALGSSTFRLSDDFREDLKNCLGFKIPDCAYVAMDYHIDWIKMAVYLDRNPGKRGDIIRTEEEIEGINKNQQDVDLLVAFTRGSATHLVLIEAKGDTPWSSKQLDSKVNRLRSISPGETLKLHLVLMSPRQVKRIDASEWPDWMKKDGSLNHLPLRLAKHLCKITRCDTKGNKLATGDHYRIDPVAKS